MDELVKQISQAVLNQMDFSREYSDEEIRSLIFDTCCDAAKTKNLGIKDRIYLENTVFNSLRRFGSIQELLEDPDVTEVMVNGPKHIFYEKKGKLYEWFNHFESEEKLADLIQKIVGDHNRVVNLSSPIVDTRLRDGSRVNIVLAPVSVDGSSITIRKFPRHPISMDDLLSYGSISREAADFLSRAVQKRYSILVSGGTGTGKTTFLNALSAYIPQSERVITIEDSAELQLEGIPNLVRMETRNANMEQVKEITIRDLIRTALRMRPDRIIVGECRGSEAFDMLQAMNTGHDGSLSTAHANSCQDLLSRLEMMVRMGMELPLDAIRSQIASGINLIIHLERMSDRSRRVVEIAELTGVQEGKIQLNMLYKREGLGELCKVGELENTKKF